MFASDGAAFDDFGWSVAVDADTAIVGANYDNPGSVVSAGSAYVFVRSGGTWAEQQKLTAFDAEANDEFGVSVAVDGDTAVVGVPYADEMTFTNTGAAYVFVRSGTVWTFEQKLIASDPAGEVQLGRSVAVHGDTAVVGACGDPWVTPNYTGAAYVFVRSAGVWTQQAKLTALDGAAQDQFGFSVAIDGDTTAVGAVSDDHGAASSAGSAYVFIRGGGVWTQQGKLIASDAAAGDELGLSVAIDGDTVAAGARGVDQGANNNAGAAYVFVRSGGVWTEQSKLTASDAAASDYFGIGVGVFGDTAVIGASGDDHLGGVDAGSAYVFLRSGSTWTEGAKLVGSDAAPGDQFAGPGGGGNSIAIDGNLLVVGVWLDDHAGGVDAGSAYVFSLCPCSPPDCNNHGTCNSGACLCDSGYAGTACDQCAPDYYNYPVCTYCFAPTTCSGYGTCNSLGGCDCDTGYAGTACGQCAPDDYYNYPTCKYCHATTTCSGRGTCNSQGDCVCDTGYTGPACNLCVTDTVCSDGSVCTVDECDNGTCVFIPKRYGDIDGNGFITLADLFAVLNAFAGIDPCCGG